jgi:hypothetical protein
MRSHSALWIVHAAARHLEVPFEELEARVQRAELEDVTSQVVVGARRDIVRGGPVQVVEVAEGDFRVHALEASQVRGQEQVVSPQREVLLES